MGRRNFGFAAMSLAIKYLLIVRVSSISLLEIDEEYAKEEAFLRNLVNGARYILEQYSTTETSYCALISSSLHDRPLTMTNMLKFSDKPVHVINTWANSDEENVTITNVLRSNITCDDIIVFVSPTNAENVIDKLRFISSTEARLLMVVCEALESEDEAKKSAETMVKFAWRNRLGKAITLVAVEGRVLILKSDRHVPHVRCAPESPRVTAYWINDTLTGELSFESLRYDKCLVRIASGNCDILSRVEMTSDGLVRAVGVEGQMIDAIAEKQNFTFRVMNITVTADPGSKKENSNYEAARESLESGEADMAACSLWITHPGQITFTIAYSKQQVVLMVPVAKFVPILSMLHTFGKPVWIGIIVSLIMGRIMIRMDRKTVSSLTVLGLFLGVSVTSRSRGFVEKWQMMFWVIYGYIITQSYIASLASVLNNPWLRKIQTIEELAMNGIPVAGPTPNRANFVSEEKYKRILETYVDFTQAENADIQANPEKIILAGKSLAVLVDIRDSERWGSSYYRLKEGVVSYSIGSALVTRGVLSPQKIGRIIATLIENGLIAQWTMIEVQKRKKRLRSFDVETLSPTLSLEEVTGIFIILIVGLALSIIVFVFEIYRRNLSRKMNLDQHK